MRKKGRGSSLFSCTPALGNYSELQFLNLPLVFTHNCHWANAIQLYMTLLFTLVCTHVSPRCPPGCVLNVGDGGHLGRTGGRGSGAGGGTLE